jgi:dihydrofolate reductase/thymidylate synthase
MINYIGIVAFAKSNGIGKSNTVPWKLKDDLILFKTITTNNIVVMGKNTYDSIPAKHRPLPNRLNIVLTNSPDKYENTHNLIFTTYPEVENIIHKHAHFYQGVFVIGGASIYNLFYKQMSTLYVTYIDKQYDYDTFFPCINNEFKLLMHSKNHWSTEEQCYFRFMKYERTYTCAFDKTYLSLASKILTHGVERGNRTDVTTLSMFGEQIEFDISHNVPLLTTKRVAWRSCIEELLWFMRGDTNANILKDKKVNIWNGNSTREFLDNVGLTHLNEGDCGANYSFQWRFSGQQYVDCDTSYVRKTKYDQINNIINLLQNDPYSRRIFLSAWNPLDLDKTVLPPCHVSAQFYVDNNRGLSCHMYQRSCDVFLGLPFNIFSYSVLTYILAKKCDMTPARLIISLGDTHIYSNHIEQVKEQLNRVPMAYPMLKVSDSVKAKEIEDITIDDFEVVGYFPHNSIKAPMAV